METILIVEDSLLQAQALERILEGAYQVQLCSEGRQALKAVEQLRPSLILLDIIMPGMDGFAVLEALKQNERVKDIPVILITGLSDTKNEEKGLLLGAVDYIIKPFHDRVVKARVDTHTQLYRYRRAMEHLAQLDGLTGIPNRRSFDQQLQKQWGQAMADRAPLAIGMLDVDLFKQYNDKYGHLQGDDALKFVAKTLYSTLQQPEAFTARYGGEEFVFLLWGDAVSQGEALATSLCESISLLGLPHPTTPSGVLTVSLGLLTLTPTPHLPPLDALRQADALLYQAKAQGRNRVVVG